MRPLCGAIITAGALIGMGMFTIGYGTRYQHYAERDADGHFSPQNYWVRIGQMDTPLLVLLCLLIASLLIGMAIAFVGLAYHHHKRHLELMHHKDHSLTTSPGLKI